MKIKLDARGRASRGWGPWRSDFYSICSRLGGREHGYGSECPRCNHGQWQNRWAHHIGHYFFRHHYRLWYWWVNRPNSKDRKFLEKTFPKLRRND